MTGIIQTIINRKRRASGSPYPSLPEGTVFLSDERNKRLLDEEEKYLTDRKEEQNG